MYKAIHRIEMIINAAPIIVEPGSVVEDIPNAKELLEAGAIIEYALPELQVVPVAIPVAAEEAPKRGKKAAAEKAPASEQDFG